MKHTGLFSPEPALVQTIFGPPRRMCMTVHLRGFTFEDGSFVGMPIESQFFYEGEQLDDATRNVLEIELWARNLANDVASLHD